ncbi:TraC family protein [Brucella thiophenivorans]|uniref:TraC-like family protein n=1 Tax=Brucella thiophenivorans TaxID=571255 RepID=A0A256FRU2_9HYPH|nr:TraC family protein [Brucella thiophenivorans]OYR17592.1 traC-like family protein [Brucella thiophenivorans]
MARGKSTKAIAAIQEKMEKLQAELEAAMKQQAADIGNLAVASGLGDIPHAELKKAFAEIAARFQTAENK